MAQKVHIILEDDLDGGEATQTVAFGLDGDTYEIDLSDENATKMREAFATYIEKGRTVARKRGRKPAAVAAAKSTTSGRGGRRRTATVEQIEKEKAAAGAK